MSCFHPLKGFKIGYHESGKPNYMITSYDTKYVKKINNGNWVSCKEWLQNDILSPIVSDSIDIPCGHCIGCLLDKSRDWADRCMLEASLHEKNCFITLTFDEDHIKMLPKSWYCDKDGVYKESPFYSNDKSIFQKFMKRLREKLDRLYGIKIRYFACSEYGDFEKSGRPHFHAIIFGYDFSDDRSLFKQNFNGDNLYISELLASVWTYGFHTIADCTWNTCAYVSRYCLKKRYNNLNVFYDTFNLEPESVFMSRRPGIARLYYDNNKSDIYRFESITIGDENGSRTLRPPRYFDKLYDVDYPEDMQRIKDHRMENAIRLKDEILSRTDLDYLDYLKVQEYNFHNKTKILGERSCEL